MQERTVFAAPQTFKFCKNAERKRFKKEQKPK